METINYIQRNQLSTDHLHEEISGLMFQSRYAVFFKITELNAPVEVNPPKKIDRIPFEDVLAGLSEANIPIAFSLANKDNRISIKIGTWADAENNLITRSSVLEALIGSSNEYIKFEKCSYAPIPELTESAIVIGMPVSKIESDKNLPIDRLLQAMGFCNWQCLILAEPNGEASLDIQTSNLLTELRQVTTSQQDNKVPNPLSEYYVELLKAGLKHLQDGKEIGSWQTSVYLSGDENSCYQLAGVWKSIYSGEQSKPQPIHIWRENKVAALLNNLQVLNTVGKPGTTTYRNPFEYKTILSSKQLSAYIHLPRTETPGISLLRLQEFDSATKPIQEKDAITLGKVIQRNKILDKINYLVDVALFTQHCFIPGMTGSGKTTTIFNILKGAWERNVSFLTIESAKTEYRALLNDPFFKDSLQVFTLGNENVSPFRLNPFEVPPNIPVSVHLDLLRSVFSSSFGMWTPLPQVLEQCLYRIYEDKGWNLTFNSNYRTENQEFINLAFPTLTDLYNKVEDVATELGYEDKVRDNIRASLLTRINSLRTGGKGNMLDTQSSLPMEVIFEKPTILELDSIGDDDDKAFIIGLLFIRMVEYRRGMKREDLKQHIMVIEEAHRLLSNPTKGGNSEEGDPKGKAVETFSNLLSEIRSYKQGVIIADQVPVKLAPDVIKNTNLKIAHRIVSNDDRTVMAGAMAMNEEQTNSFSTLNRGETLIFITGDDLPVKVKIVNKKDELSTTIPSDAAIRKSMSGLRKLPVFANVLSAIVPQADLSDPKYYLAENAAKKAAEDRSFQLDFIKLITTITEIDYNNDSFQGILQDSYDRWKHLMQYYLNETMDKLAFEIYVIINMSAWYAFRLGTKKGWPLLDTDRFGETLQQILFEIHDEDYSEIEAFHKQFYDLHIRSYEPFQCCKSICAQEAGKPRMCLYRFPIEEAIGNKMIAKSEVFIDTVLENNIGIKNKLSTECEPVIDECINSESKKRIMLCYAQHMIKNRSLNEQESIISSINL